MIGGGEGEKCKCAIKLLVDRQMEFNQILFSFFHSSPDIYVGRVGQEVFQLQHSVRKPIIFCNNTPAYGFDSYWIRRLVPHFYAYTFHWRGVSSIWINYVHNSFQAPCVMLDRLQVAFVLIESYSRRHDSSPPAEIFWSPSENYGKRQSACVARATCWRLHGRWKLQCTALEKNSK